VNKVDHRAVIATNATMVDDNSNNDSKEKEQAVVSCGTSAGPIVMQFTRHWSPNGYDRVVELFERSFFDHSHFFRVAPHFLVQFGISYSDDKDLQALARHTIADDPQMDPPIAFDTGMISFAGKLYPA
jgi:cyclophilin family peptidyl-prolyl cis-trans isomerase